MENMMSNSRSSYHFLKWVLIFKKNHLFGFKVWLAVEKWLFLLLTVIETEIDLSVAKSKVITSLMQNDIATAHILILIWIGVMELYG